MGPLLEIVVQINPQIVMTSFIGTAVLFGCFSAAALTARRGQWLYLGGTLMTMLASLIVLSLANIFLGSQLIFQVKFSSSVKKCKECHRVQSAVKFKKKKKSVIRKAVIGFYLKMSSARQLCFVINRYRKIHIFSALLESIRCVLIHI